MAYTYTNQDPVWASQETDVQVPDPNDPENIVTRDNKEEPVQEWKDYGQLPDDLQGFYVPYYNFQLDLQAKFSVESKVFILDLDSRTTELEETTITAGDGLTGGGDLSDNRTLNVGAGDGITVNANSIQISTSIGGDGISYSSGILSLSSSVAGNGLSYSSGVLTVGAGNGISVSGTSVALASSTAGDGLTFTSGVLAVDKASDFTPAVDEYMDTQQQRNHRTLTTLRSTPITSSGTYVLDFNWDDYEEIIIDYANDASSAVNRSHHTFYTDIITASNSAVTYIYQLSSDDSFAEFNLSTDGTSIIVSGDIGGDDQIIAIYGRYKKT